MRADNKIELENKEFSNLLKNIEMKRNDLRNVNDAQKVLYEKESLVRKQIEEENKKLQLICKHQEHRAVNEYFEGGYYDVSQSVKTVYCKICGKELSKKSTTGGYA